MRNLFSYLTRTLEAQSRRNVWGFTLLTLLLLGILDATTRYEMGFAAFYILPVFTAAWALGQEASYVIACLSALIWLLSDLLTHQPYTHDVYIYWNTFTRLIIYLFTAFSLSELRQALARERTLAHVDALTGLLTRAPFYDLVNHELTRTQRVPRPLTLLYFDIDNFKSVNDNYGHAAGDRVLQHVADTLRTSLRATDAAVRLGGDEFAVFLPETGDAEARVLVPRLQQALLKAMTEAPLPITFSIGVVTRNDTPTTVDGLIQCADELMYSVKWEGKNNIAYTVLEGSESLAYPEKIK